ncbi:MAG: ABC transporter permease [Burkholderiaceae bacterium]|nr:ABC transporter permease [Burkholderiaceae bacterium]MEB2350470.1 ABC transporter permease [Burkholderiaceae bacterium]
MVSGFAVQLLNGLAGASTLFLIAVGLSLIFGVTRIVNFAHGSMYMIGLYVAYSLTQTFAPVLGAGPPGFWASIVLAAVAVGALGALVELTILRRIYRAPELFQLLATFAVVLMLRDAALAIWGPDDLLGPKAPAMKGAVTILGRQFPQYDLFLIFVGPVVLGLLWLLLRRTRAGVLIRAATQDREMVGALGVNQAWLFTGVFALGSALAALGGALQLPREPANLALDLTAIGDAFVVVVVGGMGSIPGAYLAALIIAEIKAICYGIGTVELMGTTFSFSKLTMVVEFLVMAAVLIWRPWGLLGKPQAAVRSTAAPEAPMRPMGRAGVAATAALVAALLALPLLGQSYPYLTVLMIDILIAVLFATSLHFIMGPGGMHSFGHAAYFGLGAYGAAALLRGLALPMEMALLLAPLAALAGAALFGWFAVRLSGVYLAMLTLAFAQIVWSIVYQWDEVTGGSNGMVGIWPSERFASKAAYYYLVLALVGASVFAMRRMLFSPFGYAMRAGRDSPLRAESTGIGVTRVHWTGFMVAGAFCGLAGALFAFGKGSISPETIHVVRSIDGLVMVLLGGVQTVAGPVAGSAVFTWLQDSVSRATDYWRALLGVAILVLVLAFPQGIVGGLLALAERLGWRGGATTGARG